VVRAAARRAPAGRCPARRGRRPARRAALSGIRRIARAPWHARLSERRFLRWSARETGADRFASIGEGSVVYAPALIIGHHLISVGRDVVVHPGAFLSVVDEHGGRRYDAGLTIGDGVRIGNDVVVACCGRIEIADRVLIADRVFIGDTYHEYRDVERAISDQGLHDPRPVSIGRGAFLGINSAVLAGVTVGAGAYVGAHAVVTRDVPAHTVVVGNPARAVRRWDGTAWAEVPAAG
jgi:acetyltransferase-like isoleucine patch superfamily enzyme